MLLSTRHRLINIPLSSVLATLIPPSDDVPVEIWALFCFDHLLTQKVHAFYGNTMRRGRNAGRPPGTGLQYGVEDLRANFDFYYKLLLAKGKKSQRFVKTEHTIRYEPILSQDEVFYQWKNQDTLHVLLMLLYFVVHLYVFFRKWGLPALSALGK